MRKHMAFSSEELHQRPNFAIMGAGIPDRLRRTLSEWTDNPSIIGPSNPANPFGDPPRLHEVDPPEHNPYNDPAYSPFLVTKALSTKADDAAAGGLLGMLSAMTQQANVRPGANSNDAPNNAPAYEPDSYGSAAGGLLGRLLTLQAEQNRYQPNAGTGTAPPPPASAQQMQAQYEADQAQHAREAAASRLTRGVINLSRMAAPPPDPIDIAKSAGTGVINGTIGLVGTPFQALDWAHHAVNKGIDAAFNAVSGPPKPSPSPPNINAAATPESIRRFIEERITGKFHQPTSTSGRYAETIGEMAPLVLGQGALAIGQGAARGGASAAFRNLGTRLMTDAVLPGTAVQAVENAFPDSPAGQWLRKAWPVLRRSLPYGPAVLEGARRILGGQTSQ
jgi:hypothetical protein